MQQRVCVRIGSERSPLYRARLSSWYLVSLFHELLTFEIGNGNIFSGQLCQSNERRKRLSVLSLLRGEQQADNAV